METSENLLGRFFYTDEQMKYGCFTLWCIVARVNGAAFGGGPGVLYICSRQDTEQYLGYNLSSYMWISP